MLESGVDVVMGFSLCLLSYYPMVWGGIGGGLCHFVDCHKGTSFVPYDVLYSPMSVFVLLGVWSKVHRYV